MILKMWLKSKFSFVTYWLKKKKKSVHVFEIFIFWKLAVIFPISRSSLQAASLDDILFGNFTLSNSVILVKDLVRWKRGFEIFLISHYGGGIGNKNIAGKY